MTKLLNQDSPPLRRPLPLGKNKENLFASTKLIEQRIYLCFKGTTQTQLHKESPLLLSMIFPINFPPSSSKEISKDLDSITNQLLPPTSSHLSHESKVGHYFKGAPIVVASPPRDWERRCCSTSLPLYKVGPSQSQQGWTIYAINHKQLANEAKDNQPILYTP